MQGKHITASHMELMYVFVLPCARERRKRQTGYRLNTQYGKLGTNDCRESYIDQL